LVIFWLLTMWNLLFCFTSDCIHSYDFVLHLFRPWH
jgi:hypothetical protein